MEGGDQGVSRLSPTERVRDTGGMGWVARVQRKRERKMEKRRGWETERERWRERKERESLYILKPPTFKTQYLHFINSAEAVIRSDVQTVHRERTAGDQGSEM